jgi:gamma-glutamyltranspeptidase/glutathione hydrolase
MDGRELSEARRFPRCCVATPHHLASSAGLAVLASGGNAIDAVVAANLTLGVVAPYLCGYGGDLFALVWREGEGLSAYNGSGRSGADAAVEAVRRAAGADSMPAMGPLPITVPGAVRGWFDLLERFGTRSFAELAPSAVRLARDGFPLSARGALALELSKRRFEPLREGSAAAWWEVYGDAQPRAMLRQPGMARTIQALASEGPEAYYLGPIAQAIAETVGSLGGFVGVQDLAEHRGDWIAPLVGPYRDVDVVQLPPNTQGVTVLEALRIVEATGPLPREGVERHHLLLEATKLALSDRDAFVTDPEHMRVDPSSLYAPERVAERARRIDPARAGAPDPGRVAVGGTAFLCAADADGTMISLIQSNYMGFGSGVTVPGWGINLHDRGAFFSLRPDHANVVAPRKRTLHTLIPAMAMREGRPWLVFGTMGGDGQAQIHVQLMARMIDDREDPQRTIDAPRWIVSSRDWSVTADARFGPDVLERLRALGHQVSTSAWFDPVFGHAHAIEVTETGYAGATDPRAEGAVLGM